MCHFVGSASVSHNQGVSSEVEQPVARSLLMENDTGCTFQPRGVVFDSTDEAILNETIFVALTSGN